MCADSIHWVWSSAGNTQKQRVPETGRATTCISIDVWPRTRRCRYAQGWYGSYPTAPTTLFFWGVGVDVHVLVGVSDCRAVHVNLHMSSACIHYVSSLPGSRIHNPPEHTYLQRMWVRTNTCCTYNQQNFRLYSHSAVLVSSSFLALHLHSMHQCLVGMLLVFVYLLGWICRLHA